MESSSDAGRELRLPQPYTTLPHTADLALEVHGRSAAEALGRLVLAYSQVVTAGEPADPAGTAEISVAGGAALSLIAVDVLRAVHALLTTEGRVPVAVHVLELSAERGARLRLACGRFDAERHGEGADIKAVTYHQAELAERAPGDAVGRIIVDI